ncbi:MAG: sigma-70 family RNA polymerase sigma factor [Fimbriimonadaceae bacterium]
MNQAVQVVVNDHERFQELLDQHGGIAAKVVRTYCWDVEDQRDLMQEISYQLWRAFPSYDASRSFSTWMYRIALNVAISFARKPRIVTSELAGHDEAKSNISHSALALQAFMNQLDELNRALLLLHLEDLSYQEIADILGITASNVGTKLNRLKERIRNELKLD